LEKMFDNQMLLVLNNVTEVNGIGYQTMQKWEKTQDTFFDLGVITKKINLTDMFTNDFLPKNK